MRMNTRCNKGDVHVLSSHFMVSVWRARVESGYANFCRLTLSQIVPTQSCRIIRAAPNELLVALLFLISECCLNLAASSEPINLAKGNRGRKTGLLASDYPIGLSDGAKLRPLRQTRALAAKPFGRGIIIVEGRQTTPIFPLER